MHALFSQFSKLCLIKRFQKQLHGSAVFQNNGFHVFRFIQQFIVGFPLVFIEVPDPFQKFQIDPLRTALAHIRPYFAIGGNHPFQHTQQAGKTGKVQIDDRIAAFDPLRHGTVEIAVHDPLLFLQFFEIVPVQIQLILKLVFFFIVVCESGKGIYMNCIKQFIFLLVRCLKRYEIIFLFHSL